MYLFDGTYVNKTKIDNGEYRVLMRVLKVTGNPHDDMDYEDWLGPVLGVISS